MFFVIPEMPSKTFVMLYKKLPDHFNLFYPLKLLSLYTFIRVPARNPDSAGGDAP